MNKRTALAIASLRGPMWYNTEESLSPVFFPGREVIAGFQFRF